MDVNVELEILRMSHELGMINVFKDIRQGHVLRDIDFDFLPDMCRYRVVSSDFEHGQLVDWRAPTIKAVDFLRIFL